MALWLYPWLPLTALLTRGELPNAERAAAMSEPLLVVHGTADRVVPYDEGLLLAQAVPGARFLSVPGAGHDDLDAVAGASLTRAVRAALDDWVR